MVLPPMQSFVHERCDDLSARRCIGRTITVVPTLAREGGSMTSWLARRMQPWCVIAGNP
jgi:hypothetical protein